jgi:hypothetical protein
MSITTQTTTAPNGEVTKVVSEGEAWYESEKAKFHDTLTNWTSHIESLSKASGWIGIAYAAYSFARHLI